MGRPSLEVRKTTVRLPVALFERIAALVGENRMAVFIREAVLSELERREAAITTVAGEAGSVPGKMIKTVT